MIINIISVFLGGGIGAVARFLCGIYFYKHFSTNLPVVTFTVNIVSCFLMGFLYAIFMSKADLSPAFKFSLTTGFCGGLSTFSALSLELLIMMKNAQYLLAFGYASLSVIVCLISVWLGVCCARLFV